MEGVVFLDPRNTLIFTYIRQLLLNTSDGSNPWIVPPTSTYTTSLSRPVPAQSGRVDSNSLLGNGSRQSALATQKGPHQLQSLYILQQSRQLIGPESN